MRKTAPGLPQAHSTAGNTELCGRLEMTLSSESCVRRKKLQIHFCMPSVIGRQFLLTAHAKTIEKDRHCMDVNFRIFHFDASFRSGYI